MIREDADKPSLQMLRFVARETMDARILIVGTYAMLKSGSHHRHEAGHRQASGVSGIERLR